MKQLLTSIKNWFAGLWVVIKYDCLIITNVIIKGAAWIMVIGLLYFFVQTMLSGNVWQSILSLCIGATIGIVVTSLLVTAHKAEDNMYEVAVANLQKQLTDAESNYDLMRIANQSIQKDKELLQADIQRQAEIIAELVTKHNKLYLENDMLKAKQIRIGGSSINSSGKIV